MENIYNLIEVIGYLNEWVYDCSLWIEDGREIWDLYHIYIILKMSIDEVKMYIKYG